MAIHSYKGIEGKKYQPINFDKNTKNFKIIKYQPINFSDNTKNLKVIKYQPINFDNNTKNLKITKYQPINFNDNTKNLKVIKYQPINFDNNTKYFETKNYKPINFDNIALLDKKRFEEIKEKRLNDKRKEAFSSIIYAIFNIPNIITELLFQPFNNEINKKYKYINPNKQKGFYDEININNY